MTAADDINRLAHELGRSSGEVLDKLIRMSETRQRMLDGLPPRDDEEIIEREAYTYCEIRAGFEEAEGESDG
jgi:hypothetical protein